MMASRLRKICASGPPIQNLKSSNKCKTGIPSVVLDVESSRAWMSTSSSVIPLGTLARSTESKIGGGSWAQVRVRYVSGPAAVSSIAQRNQNWGEKPPPPPGSRRTGKPSDLHHEEQIRRQGLAPDLGTIAQERERVYGSTGTCQ